MSGHGDSGQLGEGADAVQSQEEKEEDAPTLGARAAMRSTDRLLLFLGVSSLFCWAGMILLVLLQRPAMPLFLASVGLLLMMGVVITARAAWVMARFQTKRAPRHQGRSR